MSNEKPKPPQCCIDAEQALFEDDSLSSREETAQIIAEKTHMVGTVNVLRAARMAIDLYHAHYSERKSTLSEVITVHLAKLEGTTSTPKG